MFVYTVRKFNLFIITLLILTMVGYSLARFDPHSPWTLIGFWQGWSSYLVQLMEFNFGLNKNGVPIIHELLVVFPATIELCTIAFILSLLVGIPIGTLAGMRQGKWLDTIISFISMSGYSAPIFWLALMMIMAFSLHFPVFPVAGRYDLLYQIDHVTGFA